MYSRYLIRYEFNNRLQHTQLFILTKNLTCGHQHRTRLMVQTATKSNKKNHIETMATKYIVLRTMQVRNIMNTCILSSLFQSLIIKFGYFQFLSSSKIHRLSSPLAYTPCVIPSHTTPSQLLEADDKQ